MSKYARLGSVLRAKHQREISCSFRDIERALGFPLPPAARAHRAWWSNNPSNNVMTKAWLDAGFRAEQVDMGGETLVFRRVEEAGAASKSAPARKAGARKFDDTELIGRILDVLRGDQREAQALRQAIVAALDNAGRKSPLDVFGSDLPEETFEDVFDQPRPSDWREVQL